MNSSNENKEEKQEDLAKRHSEHYINQINVSQKASMKNRIIVGALLVLLVVPCVMLGNYVFAALIVLASLISCHEIIKAPQSIENKFSNILYVFSYFMMLSLIFWIIFKNNMVAYDANPEKFTLDLTTYFSGPRISLACFFICATVFIVTVFFDKNFKISDAFYFICMLLIVSVGFQSLLFLRFAPFTYSNLIPGNNVPLTYESATNTFKFLQSTGLIFYMLIGTCLNDVGAYFIGVLFGKHKMSPRISPKKTWEGFVGGYVTSMVFSLAFAFVTDACGLPIMEGVLDTERWYNLLILSFLMPVFAVVGDLFFSSIKRNYQIKDFGTALRSHGGVLDRIDSILIVSIMMALFIELMANGWNIMSATL